jgi:hypothetical protein
MPAMATPSPSSTRSAPLERTFAARIGPGGRSRRAFLVALAAISALPTLVWAFGGAELMHDDWWLATSFARGDGAYRWSEFWATATQHPGRPGAALYYLVTYSIFGTNPVLHALLQAVVCAVLGVLVFLVAERLWRTGLAIWIAAVYAVLPNRGSTRLWFAVATYPLAIVLLLVAVLFLLRGRPVLAALLLAAATLTYEGVFGLALLAVATWTLADLGRRWRVGAGVGTAVVASAAYLFLISPKRSGGTQVGGLSRLMSSQFGAGIFEWGDVAKLAPTVLALGLTLMMVLRYPGRDLYRRVVPAGLVLVLAGWMPFFLTNWPIATDGFFDRANGVVGLGTAVLLGALLSWIVDLTPQPVGLALAGGSVVFLLLMNVPDVEAFRRAAGQGQVLLDQVAVDVPVGSGPLVVVPTPVADRGIMRFPAGSNLADALRFRRGDLVEFWIEPEVEETPAPPGASCYDLGTRKIGSCDTEP